MMGETRINGMIGYSVGLEEDAESSLDLDHFLKEIALKLQG